MARYLSRRAFATQQFDGVKNNSIRLAKRPTGFTSAENWTFSSEVITPSESDIVVKVTSLSLDPAMRGWLNDAKSYIPPVGIGEVMRAGGIGKVVFRGSQTDSPLQVGDFVSGMVGVQEYTMGSASDFKKSGGLHKVDLSLGTENQWLNVLGMPGMTAYFGLKDVGLPKAGETIVVSAAAGAVGQTVGQLAKIYGLRVVGIAGGSEKCDWVVKELGFDACIDYKSTAVPFSRALKEACPNGVDIYFDNVGGDILDNVLARINRSARIVICGAISQYNNTSAVIGPKNYLSLLVNRARMEGMVVFDYAKKYPMAIAEMSRYLKAGHMTSKEHVVDGLENFPDALNFLFAGKNFGKLILRVSKD